MFWQLFSAFFIFLSVFAAHGKTTNFPNKILHLSLSFETPSYDFTFEDKTTESMIVYKPNLNELTTPGISYSGIIGASYGFKTNISDEDKQNFGDTKYEDWRFNYAFNAFMAGVHYSQYTGFYIENSNFVDGALTDNDPKIQLPDMYVRTVGGYFTWVWDRERFSMPGVVDQTGRQEGWGGSWLFGGALGEATFNNPTGLIPTSVQSQFAGAAGLHKGKFTYLTTKGGYGYGWGRKWFAAGVVQFGLGLQKRKLFFQNGTTTSGLDAAWRAEAIIAAGYNGDDFYSGLKSLAFGNIYNGAGLQINSTQTNIAVFFGLHI